MKKSDKRFFRILKLSKIKKDFIELVEGITFKEILVILSFPIFITILMFLPPNIIDSLSLHVDNPQWWQFFTSSFIHENLIHLLDNIQTYFIISFVLLIFANKTKNKKNFFTLFLFNLISLPLISSLIEVLIYPKFIPSIKTSQGSSVLISSMLGFFPMFWIYYFSKKQKNNTIDKFFNLSLSYLYLLIVVIYYQIHKNILLVSAFFFYFLFYCYFYRKDFKVFVKNIYEESKNNIIFCFLTIFFLIFFMTAPLILFPLKFVKGNTVIDIFIHYIGLFYGIIISYVFFKSKIKKV